MGGKRFLFVALVSCFIPCANPAFADDDNDSSAESWVTRAFKRLDGSVCMIHEHLTGQSEGLGSGVVVDAEAGLVVTAHHVIDGLKTIGVTFHQSDSSFTTCKAEVLCKDTKHDLAVLRIVGPHPRLTEAKVGPGDVEIGSDVFVIGNPFGRVHSLTVGHVSRVSDVEFDDEKLKSCIQTDAAINSGNSGGPLFARDGRLVGIVVRRISPFIGDGMGFAVNIDEAETLMLNNATARQLAGVHTGIETQYHGRRNSQNVWEVHKREGVFVKSASAPAKELKKADKIISVTVTKDGNRIERKIRSRWDFTRAFYDTAPGDEVGITVMRDGKEFKTTIKLDGPGLEEDGSVKPAEDAFDWWWY